MNGFKIEKQEMPDPTSVRFTFQDIGIYNPLAATVVSLNNLVWADGSTTVPTDEF
jgi:hypothetical protein